MELGVFSVSISVKDLAKSKEFYKKIGFEVFGGNEEMNYLIMRNGKSLVGLFQGMFEGNMLTFNPGLDHNAQNLEDFTDVRDIKKAFEAKGIQVENFSDPHGKGPASFVVVDPDGNPILLDQHR